MRKFRVIVNNEQHDVVLLERNNNSFHLKINGKNVLATIEQPIQAPVGVRAVGLQVNEVKAPFASIVSKIWVTDGNIVEKDQPLVTLEAMKMQNLIRSPRRAKIKSVLVNQGQKVEKEQVILIFE